MSGYMIEHVGSNYAVVAKLGWCTPQEHMEFTEVVPIVTYLDWQGEIIYDQTPSEGEELHGQWNKPFLKAQVAAVIIGPTRDGRYMNFQPFSRSME